MGLHARAFEWASSCVWHWSDSKHGIVKHGCCTAKRWRNQAPPPT